MSSLRHQPASVTSLFFNRLGTDASLANLLKEALLKRHQFCINWINVQKKRMTNVIIDLLLKYILHNFSHIRILFSFPTRIWSPQQHCDLLWCWNFSPKITIQLARIMFVMWLIWIKLTKEKIDLAYIDVEDQWRSKLDNWGEAHIHIFMFCTKLISFEIDCFHAL